MEQAMSACHAELDDLLELKVDAVFHLFEQIVDVTIVQVESCAADIRFIG